MQYPQIQFYRGSLVRLASGKLKQVEDLSSDDFLESARLARSVSTSLSSLATINGSGSSNNSGGGSQEQQQQVAQSLLINPANQQMRQRPGSAAAAASSGASFRGINDVGGSCSSVNNNNNQHQVDENNNSVFNSPEPTPSFDSSTVDMMETDEVEDYATKTTTTTSAVNMIMDDNEGEEDDDEELDVVSDHQTPLLSSHNQKVVQNKTPSTGATSQNSTTLDDDLYVDSSVVRDFLEVEPPSSASPPSNNSAYHLNSSQNPDLFNQFSMGPSTSSSSSSHSPNGCIPRSSGCLSPPINMTVLIKFFLDSSRSVVFIEVPIEHPFFVLHRGWSSFNPQRTFDKFGLKCRKLKIGDTCISLIRRQRNLYQQHHKPQQQQESDRCNILLSSIKINE